MAKPSLLTHPKFRRLVHDLDIGEAAGVGHLELLWHVAYETGNARIGDTTDVELAARWCARDGKLCAALARCGFIDENDDGSFSIHDLHEHAPKYVKDRWDKKLKRRNVSENCRTKKATKSRRVAKSANNVGVSPPLPSPPKPLPTQEKSAGAVAEPTGPPAAVECECAIPNPEPPGTHAEFVAAFCDCWEAKYGRKYYFQTGKDGKLVKEIREHLKGDTGQWRQVVARYLISDDPFFHGHPLGLLKSQFSKFVADPPTTTRRRDGPSNDFSGIDEGVRRLKIATGET